MLYGVLIVVTDIVRIILTVMMCMFAVECYKVKNGVLLKRFGTFMLWIAGATAWFNLVYFDVQHNILPDMDLSTVARRGNWMLYVALIVALGRLWWTLRTQPAQPDVLATLEAHIATEDRVLADNHAAVLEAIERLAARLKRSGT